MNLAYKCKDNTERLNLALKLEKLGWCTEDLNGGLIFGKDVFEDTPYINIDNTVVSTQGKGYIYFIDEEYIKDPDASREPVTIVRTQKEILRPHEIYVPPKVVHVVLNSTYTAKIEGKDVKVGCQTFSFDKVKQLYDAIIEYEKKK